MERGIVDWDTDRMATLSVELLSGVTFGKIGMCVNWAPGIL
jgi:hypothetical protein